MDVDQLNIHAIVKQVLTQLHNPADELEQSLFNIKRGQDGIYPTMEEAIGAAKEAQIELLKLSIDQRKGIIEAIRKAILENLEQIARLAVSETKLGKVADKIEKNKLAVQKTPGVEDITPKAFTGDYGLTLTEMAPYGVIGAVTPSTNPSETVICNSIGMIAAGNAVVFNPHPGAKEVTKLTIKLINEAIIKAGGPRDLLCSVENPSMETSKVMMTHPDVRVLVVTGGPQIVKIAMQTGKKVIAAGPGNPPVVVDETADIKMAARDIVDGASFDNNVLCIAEKEVFVVETVGDALVYEMKACGAIELTADETQRLMQHITVVSKTGAVDVNKDYVGKDVQYILKAIGKEVSGHIRLAITRVSKDHPLVTLEQLMPVLPVVYVKDIDEAIALAVKAEQGNYHTAMMHSKNIDHLTKMARCVNTTIFVKYAPSYSGLGFKGEGYTTFTIASPTGEGLTSAKDFTRSRRCVLKDGFKIT